MSGSWKAKLESALGQRRVLLSDGTTTACRLFCGAREGVSGLVVDRYDSVLVFQVHEGSCELSEGELTAIAAWYLEQPFVKSIYVKTFVADRSSKTADEAAYSPVPFAGEPAPREVLAKENGLLYEIHPYEGYSTGIFLDQREHRRLLAKHVAGGTVLNCFAYTCAFSVACAKQGATVTSVDLSRKYLDWGKRNFEKNEIDPGEHRFVTEDTFEFLKRVEKRGEQFDLVIVDPPSFSRNGKKVFSVQKDVRRLAAAAAARVRPGGSLFFSSNYSKWDSGALAFEIREALEGKRKRRFEKLPEAPIDFLRETHPLSAVWVRL